MEIHNFFFIIEEAKETVLDFLNRMVKVLLYYFGNLEWDGDTQFFFIIEEAKETVLDFLNRMVKELWYYFVLI